MNYCFSHPQCPITGICIAPHKCQRKLCFKCLYNHEITIQQCLPFDVFLDRLDKLIENYKLNDNSKYEQIKIAFKSLISSSEQMIKKVFVQLIDSINYIFGKIEDKDKSYVNLITSNQHPAESQCPDLDNLVQLLESNILEDWNTQKNTYLQQLVQSKERLTEQMNIFSNKCQEEMREIFSIINIKSGEKKKQQVEQKEEKQEVLGFVWDRVWSQMISNKFQTVITQDNKLKYIKDGLAIRIDPIKDISTKPEILTNLEQIQHLQWVGEYNKNNKKVGKWILKWKGNILKDVGGQYSQTGQKQGLWIELIKNYWSKAEAYEVGQYENNLRIGAWNYIYEEKDFGGGEYNKQGEKNGKWIELSVGFWEYSQVSYNGEYKNGKKIGRWEIMFQGNELLSKQKQIGGGSYDDEGNGIKIGKWIELSDGFRENSQVTFSGEYRKNQKVGVWNIYWNWCGKNQEIGGGSYDQGDNGIKIGPWVEVSNGFASYWQITQNGSYTNGKKVGMWVEKDIKKNEICKEIHYKY
ncbi:unnamed protein product [Paramecium primaurelia]|uniref:MORN repeat protein n=1 Tax=Paramecium primaurelia TaxID=5886 RepID=A0A8S1PEF7_PARPR|nr:unnamed protein product [Paramecium primaurelia]